jgi:ribosomal protein S18 acetylase RimI-like enzyme
MSRKAEIADVSGIVDVHVESWRLAYAGLVPEDFLAGMLAHLGSGQRFRFWRRQILCPESRFFVAPEEGRIIGWIQAGKSRDEDSPETLEIYAIYVLPSHWRRGVGTELMMRVEREVPASKATTLWVLHNNRAAIDFYTRFGYRPDGATKTLEAGQVALREIRMRKDPARPA